jgi:uncharacterized protein YjiK|tara:strand:- start:2679 stop:3383 length:705 start_codon:yes stop_codon:yes gene_type:complete
MINFLLILISTFSFISCNQLIKPIDTYIIDCHEPSDIAYDNFDDTFYCVSDEGYISHISIDGKLLRKFKLDLRDMESVHVDSNYIYVIDERTRQVITLDKLNLNEINRKIIPYFGGSNKGFEGMTFNPVNKKWLTVTEKSPVIIFELDESFNINNLIHEPKKLSEVSGVTFYNNYLWFLGDEDRTLSKADPLTYEVVDVWIVDVPTPEGIAFANGFLYLASDNFNMIYKMDFKE